MWEFIKKYVSRKLLCAIGIILIKKFCPELPEEAIYGLLAFIGVEGVADIVSRLRSFTPSKK